MQLPKYPLPSYLQRIFTVSTFARFLKEKAQNLRNRDKKRKKSVALKFTVAQYREELHNAIMNGGRTDPYTGDAIDWTLINKWDSGADPDVIGQDGDGFDKALYLSPAVDHVDPDSNELEFEICTWIVNACKSVLNPADFIALCRKVTSHRLKSMAQTSINRPQGPINTCTSSRSTHGGSQACAVDAAYSDKRTKRKAFSAVRKYILPPYLAGIWTTAKYEHCIDVRAEDIYRRDLVLKRPYALTGSKAIYKEQIHKAFLGGDGADPYTGDILDFTAGKWPSLKPLHGLKAGRFDKAFYLLPVVDHIDPYAATLSFEICSWLVNECKNNLNPDEFIALCKKIVVYRGVTSNGVQAAAPLAVNRKRSAAQKAPWFVYILECGDGSLYTGISNNVQKRLTCHQSGKGAKYTRTHQPVTLKYIEKCGKQGKAMSREREVKRYPKKKKLALIAE
jgi:putative endonuclease